MPIQKVGPVNKPRDREVRRTKPRGRAPRHTAFAGMLFERIAMRKAADTTKK